MTAFAHRTDKVTGSAIRELFKLLGDPEIISFGGGNPAKESFPVETVRKLTDSLLQEKGTSLLQYGPTEGYAPLIDAYISHVLSPLGLDGGRQNVLVTSGSMQGIDLIARIFVDPGDTVLVESPSFLGALQTFNLYQANLVPVEMDGHGVIIERLEELMKLHRPKLFYCIPTFQNPTGKTLPEDRRRAVAELAKKYDVIVIEDDPYRELRYRGEPLKTIKSFDSAEQVVLLNSFSKTLSPGIRVGCAFGRQDIIRKMTIAKQSADTHTSNLTQAIVAEFLERGCMPPHLNGIIPDYAVRMEAMLTAMDEFFPEACAYTRPEGGLFIWGELPEGLEMLPLFKRATQELKVAFIPGEHFYVSPEMGKNTFRLNFSAEGPRRIGQGIKLLGGLFREAVEAQ